MENNEKKQDRKTILLTVGCAALATAGIVFFILGLLKYNQAGRVKEKIIYVEPDYDPHGDEAEENAKVDLVEIQMLFEDKNQLIEHVNLTRDISESTYLGNNVYAYEYEYVNQYGQQRYEELLWAPDDTKVKRYVDERFVGYSYYKDSGAFDYIQSKQYRVDLDAYELDFESNSGATSFFTTTDAAINELYAFYTHQEYDPEVNQLYHIGLYTALGQFTITPDNQDPSLVEFLVVEPRSEGNYDDMPCESAFKNKQAVEIPEWDTYASVPDFFLLGEGGYAKLFIQPKNGLYGWGAGYSNTEDDKQEYTIGFVGDGCTVEDYVPNALTSHGYTLSGDEYISTYNGWREIDGVSKQVTYTHHVKVSKIDASETPSFKNGILLVDSHRTWEPVE